MKLIERHIEKGRLLNIFSGLGAFLSAARTIGWQVTEIEPNEEAVEHAENKGLDVTESLLAADIYPDSSFNCVVLDGVLDRPVNPRTLIEQCYKLLKNNGRIITTVCNRKGLFATIIVRRNVVLRYQHLKDFSKKSLPRFSYRWGTRSPTSAKT